MFFSKRILIWTVAALATSTVVVGTAVGVTISQNRNSEQIDETHEPNMVQPGITPQPTRLDLQALVKKISSTDIVIKKAQTSSQDMMNVEPSSLYAFNVDSTQLSLKAIEGIDLDKIDVTLALSSENKNTVANLNDGKLSVEVTLKEKNASENNEAWNTIEINTFKKADAKTDFAGLFEDNNPFVLSIVPSGSDANKYTDLDSLNNQKVEVTSASKEVRIAKSISPDSIQRRDGGENLETEEGRRVSEAVSDPDGDRVNRGEAGTGGDAATQPPSVSESSQNIPASSGSLPRAEEDEEEESAAIAQPQSQSQTTTALTNWLNLDETKKTHATGVKIEGLVKVEKLSGADGKAYFHLVSKDINNRLKLVKIQDDSTKEILLSEIKTTNLLASDVTVKPITVDDSKQTDYLKALGELKNGDSAEEMNKEYLKDNSDPSLNRELSVNLSGDDKLFVKPYVTNWPNDSETKIPLSITVSFGTKDNVSSFTTSETSQLEQLKKAGFKFGLFTKKLMGNDDHVNAKIFHEKMNDLKMYFKMENYSAPVSRPSMQWDMYPAGFSLKEIDLSTSTQMLHLTVMDADQKQSENWLSFADYSYSGTKTNMVLYSPVISLIKVDKSTIVS